MKYLRQKGHYSGHSCYISEWGPYIINSAKNRWLNLGAEYIVLTMTQGTLTIAESIDHVRHRRLTAFKQPMMLTYLIQELRIFCKTNAACQRFLHSLFHVFWNLIKHSLGWSHHGKNPGIDFNRSKWFPWTFPNPEELLISSHWARDKVIIYAVGKMRSPTAPKRPKSFRL